MDPEIYKKFMVRRTTNPNVNVYLTRTPATTVNMKPADDAKSILSTKSKFSNVYDIDNDIRENNKESSKITNRKLNNKSPASTVSVSSRIKKHFSIGKNITFKNDNSDEIHVKKHNAAFDELIEAMNKADNDSDCSEDNAINDELIQEYLMFRKHLIKKRKEVQKEKHNPTINNTQTPKPQNIILYDKDDSSDNDCCSNASDSIVYIRGAENDIIENRNVDNNIDKQQKREERENLTQPIIYSNTMNHSINSIELKEYNKKGNSVITGSSSSFSFKTPEIPVDPQDIECCNKVCKICCFHRVIDFIKSLKFLSNEKRGDMVILIDKDMMTMLNYSFSSSIISNFKPVRYFIPVIMNASILFSAIFSYSNYSSTILGDNQLSWSVYFSLLAFCYNYIYYLVSNWKVHKHYIERNIQTKKRKVSYSLYYLFIFFFFYYCTVYILQLTTGDASNTKLISDNSNFFYMLNYSFYLGMYIFFTTCGACYYFVTTKLIQKGNMLHKWLHELKLRKPDINTFYKQYNKHYKRIKLFAKYWNILIFLGFVMLTFNLPLDIISILYYSEFYNLPSIIIRFVLLIWYTYCICYYNFYEKYIPSYLYKHRIYEQYKIKGIEKYMTYRPISLNFYGFTINGHLIMKSIVLFINIILPTIYGLVSNKLINFRN